MNSDSGVVTRMCGGFFAILARSPTGVSPVRTATRISGNVVPSIPARAASSASGASRLRWTSFDNALSGDTYRIAV